MKWRSLARLAPFIFLSVFAHAQQSAPTTTIRKDSRLVVVDVIATDGAGRPVPGLKASDFTVQEDKKTQAITSFDEHFAGRETRKTAPKLDLPPNVYTNFMAPNSNGPVNILLIDLLNTEPRNIQFAKQNVISLLHHLPPHQRMAMFTLGTHLQMVQGFDSSSDQLIAATNNISVLPNGVLKTVQQTADEINLASQVITDPRVLQKVVGFLIEEHAGHTDAQVSYTLEALTELAHAVAVIPGRKNLIWVSDSVPFRFLAGESVGREYRDPVRTLAALLAATHISVFPVDSRGLATSSADASIDDGEVFGDQGAYASMRMGALNAAYETMNSFAEQTGGVVFHNTNDLEGAITRSMELGSSYYTLAYRSTNEDFNGAYRKITVKAQGRKVNLLYRNGYYAIRDPLRNPTAPEKALDAAIMPWVPPSNTLLIKVQVDPPATEADPTKIAILMDPRDLEFTPGNEKQTAALRFMSIAFDSAGKAIGAVQGNTDQGFTKSGLELIMKTGVQFQQKLPLSAGKYTLRIGVIDRNSGRLGVVEVPLTVPAKAS